MVKYSFVKWEDNSTNPSRSITVVADMTIIASYSLVIHKVMFQSQPVSVQATINGQPISAGQSVDIPEGTTITVVVPGEVSV